MSCDCAYMSCADLDNRVKGVLAPRKIYIYLNTDKIKLEKIGRGLLHICPSPQPWKNILLIRA